MQIPEPAKARRRRPSCPSAVASRGWRTGQRDGGNCPCHPDHSAADDRNVLPVHSDVSKDGAGTGRQCRGAIPGRGSRRQRSVRHDCERDLCRRPLSLQNQAVSFLCFEWDQLQQHGDVHRRSDEHGGGQDGRTDGYVPLRSQVVRDGDGFLFPFREHERGDPMKAQPGNCKKLRRLFDAEGQTLPWMALLVVLLAGMGGLATDRGHAYVCHRELQASTDAAALAGAYAMASSTATTSSVQAAVSNFSSAT